MITICTFNIQNNFRNYNITKSKKIIKLLSDKNIDIYNLQEVYLKIDKDLKQFVKSLSYTINGTYRFLIPTRFNERNPIITNKKVISHKTIHLPYLPSLLKRIITKVEVEDDGKIISIYNTHLEVRRENVKKRQLEKIIKILKKDKNPIILTGDFNLKNNNDIFNDFVSELEKLNIKHIDIADKTLKISKYHRAIDHIFISDCFELVSKERITDLDISDHYPIIIKVKFK